jgi:DNA-binding transcriptional ArsR family regulator
MAIMSATGTGLDQTLMALADPTRRAILAQLAEGEARVTEIADPLPMSLNGVSKHIRMLERAGLVRRRRAGREHFLSLDPRPLDEAAAWMEAQRALWGSRLDTLETLLRAEDAAAVGAREPKRPTRKRARYRNKQVRKRSKP